MGLDKRRFPRIILGRLSEELSVVAEAKVVALDGEDTALDVFDISYDSVAFALPEGKFKSGQLVEFELKLAGFPKVEFFAEVMRVTDQLLALQLRNVPGEKRMVLEGFLKDKMIGYNTYLVSKEFYSAKEGFSHWYHGPNATNIIIWRKGDDIQRAILEFDQYVLEVVDGEWSVSASRRSQLTEYDDYNLPYSDKKETPVAQFLFEKSLNILGQMLVTLPPHQRVVLQVLVDLLDKTRG